jgi:hypothetical protein
MEGPTPWAPKTQQNIPVRMDDRREREKEEIRKREQEQRDRLEELERKRREERQRDQANEKTPTDWNKPKGR